MTITIISYIFSFIGGLGMFLYGMEVMSDGLQKKAGDKLKGLLGFLTNNRFMGVIFGAIITAVIQSSSATTVMIVGFVNSGLMSLAQAVGVIMGANIGTTMTAWIVSMNEWGSFMKPELFAPVVLGIGAFFVVFIKSTKKKVLGEILIGFALLFIGLSFMSKSMSPLAKSQYFIDLFKTMGGYPVLAILTGLIVTAVIQSSSASVGILQTLSSTGAIGFQAAAYIMLGQNIGTCITALISSAGANRMAKRAAIIHLLFNVLGSLMFAVIIFFYMKYNPVLSTSSVNSVGISIFHTIFNITNTILLFPFAKTLVKVSEKLIPIKEDKEADIDDVSVCKAHLDFRLLETPVSALNVVRDEVKHFSQVVQKNLNRVVFALDHDDQDAAKKVIKKETQINKMTNIITNYLVEISKLSLNDNQRIFVDDMLYTVSDIERVGDHCENIAEIVLQKIEHGGKFSDNAYSELKNICDYTVLSYQNAIEARNELNKVKADESIKYEQKIDLLEETSRKKHLERMTKGLCEAETGVFFLDMINNLERISDHSANISGYVQQETEI